jgi:hypothetical protein
VLDVPHVSRLEGGKEVLEEKAESKSLGLIQVLSPLEALDEELRQLSVANHKLPETVPCLHRRVEHRQANGLSILRQVSGVLPDLKREIDQRNHYADRGNELPDVSKVLECDRVLRLMPPNGWAFSGRWRPADQLRNASMIRSVPRSGMQPGQPVRLKRLVRRRWLRSVGARSSGGDHGFRYL